MKAVVATQKPFNVKAVHQIRAIFEEAGYECYFLERYTEKEQLIEAVKDADALLVRSDKVDEEILLTGAKLKIVIRAGSGYDNIDCETASKQNIVVMNTPGQNANAVAELSVAYLLMGLRMMFSGKGGHELFQSKVGLLGFGAIPKAFLKRTTGFELDVMAYSRSLTQEKADNYGAKAANSIPELFKSCPIISLHIPSNNETRGSVNYELLSQMPSNAILINTARADILNESDLFKIMKEREDFIYLSDVAPKTKEEFENTFEGRVFFSPKKLGAQTVEANINAGVAGARQIIRYFSENDTTYQVN